MLQVKHNPTTKMVFYFSQFHFFLIPYHPGREALKILADLRLSKKKKKKTAKTKLLLFPKYITKILNLILNALN
jgi:hypothetical protein